MGCGSFDGGFVGHLAFLTRLVVLISIFSLAIWYRVCDGVEASQTLLFFFFFDGCLSTKDRRI